jgi:hypothetical protein
MALLLIGLSLGVGMAGYEHFEHLGWRKDFLNAAMILGGMGPVDQDLSPNGMIFAGLYALYAGLLFIAITGLLLAPSVHHLMRRTHWEDREDPS